jgi:hypothetical protein
MKNVLWVNHSVAILAMNAKVQSFLALSGFWMGWKCSDWEEQCFERRNSRMSKKIETPQLLGNRSHFVYNSSNQVC